MAIRPLLIDKRSPFVGESCAICKEPFAPGEEIVICPEDATRHHVHCWVANQNRCAAYGCGGRGTLVRQTAVGEEDEDEPGGTAVDEPSSKVRTLPTSSVGCAQSCLIVAIAISILVIAFSCYGLWAILDYVAIELLGWQYRAPLTQLILPLTAAIVVFPTHFLNK